MLNMRYFIGDKKFYKMVLTLAIPIIIQNAVTNFVSLLDNIMVGQLGTAQMSGVSIVNQLIFVVNLCLFGGVSGAGIFSAQFWGQKNHKGVREVFRFKMIICSVICLAGLGILYFGKTELISLYLHEGGDPQEMHATLSYAREYLMIMMIGLIPFSVTQAYSSTLREVEETVIPMVASVVAVGVNMCFNCVLIFGLLGFPKLGTNGAAIATVISRFTECFIVVFWTHLHSNRFHFIKGAYTDFHVPASLVKNILITGTPLLINETLWAAGMAALNQCYSVRGLAVVAGLSISTTISNLFNVVYISLGSTISIIVGPLLGAGKMKEAKRKAYQMIFFSVAVCIVIGGIMALLAPVFPMIYHTSDEVKNLAAYFIRVVALLMPMMAYLQAAYFTIRSGGKTVITFLFDSFYLCCFSVPMAYILVHFTGWNIFVIYLICQLMDFIKCIIGTIMLKKDIWIQNLVA